MQTLTHGLLGLAMAQTTLTLGMYPTPQTPWWIQIGVTWFACGAGAVVPDLVMVPIFIRDVLQGRQPMTKQGKVTMLLKEVSHSLFTWLLLLLTAILFFSPNTVTGFLTILFTLSGMFCGVFPDIPTHSEEKFKKDDNTFLYPFDFLFKKLFGFDRLRWSNTEWEYRHDHGKIQWRYYKPWEKMLVVLLVLYTSIQLATFVFIQQ